MKTIRAITVQQPMIETDLALDGFGHWLAGFIDGEGTFFIRRHSGKTPKARTAFHPEFRVKVRSDDRAILDTIQARTGIGYVKDVKGSGNSKPQAEWIIVRKEDARRLCEILDRFPMRAKKARDYQVWRRAVLVWMEVRHLRSESRGSLRHPSQDILAVLKIEIEAIRRYA